MCHGYSISQEIYTRLLCFVVVIHWLIFPYPSGLLHWHCGNLTIAPVPAKQSWWIWINTSCEFIMSDCITTTKQTTTTPCAYLLGYTVHRVHGYMFSVSSINNIYTPVLDVSSPVEFRTCPDWFRCCAGCVILYGYCSSDFDGWIMAEWLARSTQWVAGVPLGHWGPRFKAGIQCMKQFANNWNLPCCLHTRWFICVYNCESQLWAIAIRMLANFTWFEVLMGLSWYTKFSASITTSTSNLNRRYSNQIYWSKTTECLLHSFI